MNEHDEDILRRLVARELDETSPEVERAFARSPELEPAWRELAADRATIEAAGEEQRAVLAEAREDISAADREVVAAYVAPRLARARRPGAGPPRLLLLVTLAAAAVLAGVFLWKPWGTAGPDPGPVDWLPPLSAWSSGQALEDLSAERDASAGGAGDEPVYSFRWSAPDDPLPGTSYHLSMYQLQTGIPVLRERNLYDTSWTGRPADGWPAAVVWRVEAVDASGTTYASGHAELVIDE